MGSSFCSVFKAGDGIKAIFAKLSHSFGAAGGEQTLLECPIHSVFSLRCPSKIFISVGLRKHSLSVAVQKRTKRVKRETNSSVVKSEDCAVSSKSRWDSEGEEKKNFLADLHSDLLNLPLTPCLQL